MRLGWLLGMAVAWAAPVVIGTVAARGPFQMDNAVVAGNATLFDGASIETNEASSTMRLSSGAALNMAPRSKARFFADYAVLERGAIEGRFRFEARGLKIQPDTVNASSRVLLPDENLVRVAAFGGRLRVLNASGLLVAMVTADKPLDFEPQSAVEAISKVSGCLREVGQHYILVDETTNVVVELAGAGLDKETSNRVEVTASAESATKPVYDASQLLKIISIKRLTKGCMAAKGVAAAAGAGGAEAAGSAAAKGSAAASSSGGIAMPIAIVGGVSAVATVGGLAAAGMLPGQDSGPRTLSR